MKKTRGLYIVLPIAGLFLAGTALAGGAETFTAKCKTCHSADGKGNPAMVGVMGPGIDLTKGSGDCVKVTTDGKGKMPAFGKSLSADDIKAVCDQVKSLKK